MQKMLTNVESVARPVAEGAGWRAGLGDRAGPTARGTEGPGVALLAVGPRAVAVGAGGGQAAADEARLGCRLVAAGTDARAAVERIAGADACPLRKGAGLREKREAGCGPASEATSRSAEVRYDRDQLFGVHGLGNVRLEARGQQANTVIAASVGGQCDGRQSG